MEAAAVTAEDGAILFVVVQVRVTGQLLAPEAISQEEAEEVRVPVIYKNAGVTEQLEVIAPVV